MRGFHLLEAVRSLESVRERLASLFLLRNIQCKWRQITRYGA